MKFKATYGDLFAYNNQLNDFAMKWPAVAKLVGGGYENWEKRHKVPLEYMRSKLSALYEENVSKDDKGNYETTGDEWKYKSTVHEEEFKQTWGRVMSMECEINIGYE